MRRHRVVFSAVTLSGMGLAFLLGTVGTSSPADAVDVAPRSPRVLPTRTVAAAPVARPPIPDTVELEHVVQLSPDPADVLPPSTALAPTWDPERVWPLPDALPDTPVVLALQEVLALEPRDRAEALDTLDLALLEAGTPRDPWTQLAHIEAERLLARATYDDELAHHEAALEAWAARGGRGPLPEAPAPWSASALAEDAEALALAIDAFDESPQVGELARLTAAAGWLDWTSDGIDEGQAVEMLLEVVDATDDPVVLAGAMDLLVGTDTALDDGDLATLQALAPRLPGDVALRVSWYVADQWLERGEPAASLRALDQGIDRGVESDEAQAHAVLDRLSGARGALLGLAHGVGGSTVRESLDALAWACWSRLVDEDAPWVTDGTDYAGTLVVLPAGARWVDWTDTNPHQDCMAAGLAQVPGARAPTRVRVAVRLVP